jgi:hypothetical protein
MQRFKSSWQAQDFLFAHAFVYGLPFPPTATGSPRLSGDLVPSLQCLAAGDAAMGIISPSGGALRGHHLLRTEFTGTTVWVCAATGPNVADFLQLQVDQIQEFTVGPLVDGADWRRPYNADELCADSTAAWGPTLYRLRHAVHSPRFLAELAASSSSGKRRSSPALCCSNRSTMDDVFR